jgi:phosphohistidine swiveling domain-containing protein
VEFTIESGQLYILQYRRAKRSPIATIVEVVHRVWDGDLTRAEALEAVDTAGVERASRPRFEPAAIAAAQSALLTRGLAASPGAAVGYVALTSAKAEEMAARDVPVVLVRPDTSPDDLPGMLVSRAIVTFNGGSTCHAAVVAREMGLPAVVSANPWLKLREGQLVSVDGFEGRVFNGALPIPTQPDQPELPKEVNIFLKWRRLTKIRPDFKLTGTGLSANRILNDFYLSQEMAFAAVGSPLEQECKLLYERLTHNAATVFATYLLIAVGGELRYWNYRRADNAGPATEADKRLIETLRQKFGVSPRSFDDRYDSQLPVIAKLRDAPRHEIVDYLTLAVKCFSSDCFGGSFGGAKWAAIAAEALAYFTGRHPAGVFVDHVFDLRHNGNKLFDKHSMLSGQTNEDNIVEQLDRKKATKGCRELFSSLERYGGFSEMVTYLYREGGDRSGPWAPPPPPPAPPMTLTGLRIRESLFGDELVADEYVANSMVANKIFQEIEYSWLLPHQYEFYGDLKVYPGTTCAIGTCPQCKDRCGY